jgi:hypothetical protein
LSCCPVGARGGASEREREGTLPFPNSCANRNLAFRGEAEVTRSREGEREGGGREGGKVADVAARSNTLRADSMAASSPGGTLARTVIAASRASQAPGTPAMVSA